MKSRILRTVIFVVLTLFLAGAIAAYQIRSEENRRLETISEQAGTPDIITKDFGGPFSLTSQDGEPFTEADFANEWRLIYFGFTYCPAICPTELQRMATLLDELPPQIAEQITPVFITVDPERDTVPVLRDYVSLFHPRLIGLTGSVEEIDNVKDAYKIYAAKVQDPTMSDYTVDHSSYIYLIDPDNNLRRIFKMQDSVEIMQEEVQTLI